MMLVCIVLVCMLLICVCRWFVYAGGWCACWYVCDADGIYAGSYVSGWVWYAASMHAGMHAGMICVNW